MARPPAELIEKVQRLLNEEYDPDEDSFLFIFTKRGKMPTAQDKLQTVVGEMPIQATVFFILNAIQSLAAYVHEHPFMYITRRILAPFIDMEKAQFDAAKLQAEAHDAAAKDVAEAEDGDFGDGVLIFDADLTIEN